MTYRKSLAAALVVTTMLGGVAFAAEQATQPPATQMSPAQKAVDTDVGTLSKDGAQAFRDLHLARVAIYDADPGQAKDLIGKAQAELAKAKSDEAVFKKAEADLVTPAEMSAGKTATKTATKTAATAAPATASTAPASDAKPGANEQVSWLPIDAQLTLGEDFVATPEKAAAVSDANKSLQKGDKKAALEKLKLAHVDVNFTLAVLPLDKTTADVDQAATLIGQGQYYEANALLKKTEDRMRFDVVDAIALPKTPAQAQAQGAKAAPDSTGTTQATKPAK